MQIRNESFRTFYSWKRVWYRITVTNENRKANGQEVAFIRRKISQNNDSRKELFKELQITEQDYLEFQKQYAVASEDEKKEIVRNVLDGVLFDIFQMAQRSTKQTQMAATSVTNSIYRRMLVYFNENKGDLQGFQTFQSLINFLSKSIKNLILERYNQAKNYQQIDPKGEGKKMDFPSTDNWLLDFIHQDICNKILDTLKSYFPPADLDLVIKHCYEGLSFPEIVKRLQINVTPNAMQQRFARIRKKIAEIPSIQKLADEYFIIKE